MKRLNRPLLAALPLVLMTGGLVAVGVSSDSAVAHAQPATPGCNLQQTRALYGFQCHGFSFTGSTLEPVTFVGTVRGDGKGFFEGTGTFSSSNGSVSTHVAGQATLLPNCFGHVDYTTNEIVLPNHATIPLPPVSFDYTVVNGGREILGTGVAPSGTQGDQVPRLTCRLVRVD